MSTKYLLPLGSICFHRLHRSYEAVRLLPSPKNLSLVLCQGRGRASLRCCHFAQRRALQCFLLCARHTVRPRRITFAFALSNTETQSRKASDNGFHTPLPTYNCASIHKRNRNYKCDSCAYPSNDNPIKAIHISTKSTRYLSLVTLRKGRKSLFLPKYPGGTKKQALIPAVCMCFLGTTAKEYALA